MVALSTTQA